MITILHLVRNDLVRFRWWIVLIAALVAATDILGWVVVLHPGAGSAVEIRGILAWYGRACNCLRLLEVIAGYAFVLQLVQADRLVGASAFWLTRPISGFKLLIAKATVGVLSLVILPVMVSLPWWGWCGFGPREITFAGGEFAIAAISIGIPAALVASLADAMSRALLWGVLIVPIAALVVILNVSGFFTGMPGDPGPGGLASIPAMILTLATVVTLQYLIRRVEVAAAVLILGVLASLGVSRPAGNFLVSWLSRRTSASAGPAQLQLEFVGATSTNSVVNVEQRTRVSVYLRFTGIPDGLLLTGTGAKQSWRWPQQPPVEQEGMIIRGSEFIWEGLRHLGYHPPIRDAETEAGLKKREEEFRLKHHPTQPAVIESIPGPTFCVDSWLPRSVGRRMEEYPSSYALTCSFTLVRPTLIDESSLADGSWRATAGRGLKVLRCETQRRASRTGTRESIAVSAIETDGDDLMRAFFATAADRMSNAVLVFLDENHQEARSQHAFPHARVIVNSVAVSFVTTELSSRAVLRDGKWESVPLMSPQQIRIARPAFEAVTRFDRKVTFDRFMIEPLNSPRRAALDLMTPSYSTED